MQTAGTRERERTSHLLQGLSSGRHGRNLRELIVHAVSGFIP
jgi:hypothetical protein